MKEGERSRMAAPAADAALAGLLLALVTVVGADTDAADVAALVNLYTSWNSPAQLTGWSAGGGDPCGAAWMGVSCSGSAITSMDLSNNNLHDAIPYQLPPNLTYLSLASNNFSGNLPYSISNMLSLVYLNLSHNSLFQEIGELFGNLNSLSELDVSFNNMSGNLPMSFISLSNLSSLYMQNNQLSGTVNVLSNLSLTTLNIANNNFSGLIPGELSSIPNLTLGGNSFINMPASPPPTLMPPPQSPLDQPEYPQAPISFPDRPQIPNNQGRKKQGLQTGRLIGVVVGSIAAGSCILFVLVFCLHNVHRRKDGGSSESKDHVGSLAVNIDRGSNREILDKSHQDASVATSTLPQPTGKMTPERVYGTNGSPAKKIKVPSAATSYTVASLQVATNSFCQDSLLGEGSLGRVYRADFPNGKVLALKKIDSAALSLYEEDHFLEVVSNISRLRHPNIVSLTGYCVEHGQRLLVYQYIGNGTLHDLLHFSEEASKNLTWNARVRIVLGTARALEYLHEVCLPPVVHRNLKSSNILLDEEYSPHLSDCGLAALSPNPEREVSTEVVGSFGYSAPEFAMSGTYTVKSDVYSFGVVMLELLTGRKPLDRSRERSEQSLVGWATPQLHDIDALAKMVDPAMDGMYPAKSLSRFADIIALCVQPEPEFRPPMSEVVQQLVRLLQRASMLRRQSAEDLGSSYRAPEREGGGAAWDAF
ncbi:protein STRUBBELIG-RECEPTOR FAMILY 8 isoform X2 [Brachypodium distachyon]|uniref:protein STRUBBELIG-RECEPTOR FAMILY 8 isoform X2 n=1 Tax=Brachypodium distachyon TaxID=15368 RepID=UPI00071CA8F4|nr:protein STRUBBELIG-RECEPTOR FAMILY 8 isoform X2 [Brachypodium distachyon]|eukprot:XP_014753326.1 protein STRUBBELIG-RECEPTOR FAMILY 8 isoform X2 [Brachypodium distachyon]